jgi:hypothetical protein
MLRAFESELVVLLVRCLAEGAGVELTASDLRHAAIMVRVSLLARNSGCGFRCGPS